MTRARAAFASLLVAILQLVAGIAFFRFRVVHPYASTSDLVILCLPAVVALVAHGVVGLRYWRVRTAGAAILITGGFTIVVFVATLVICVNLYGT